MQDVVGVVVLIIVFIIGAATAGTTNTEDMGLGRVLSFLLIFVVVVVACYLALAVVLGIIYVFAWFGVLIRDMLMWFIEAVLKPYDWIVPG